MTAPYYSDDFVTLYHGDCLDIDLWAARDVAVLLTDPPYGIAWTRGVAKGAKAPSVHLGIEGDADTQARDQALALWGDRPALVFGSMRAAFPPNWKRSLVFQKAEYSGLFGTRLPWRADWEPIFVLGKWPDQSPDRSAIYRTAELSAGGYNGYATRAGHAHAKPLDVLTRLLEACPPGTVSDPFAGSGSTLVAARNLGREAVGVEIDERYCELAAKRLAQQPLDIDWEDVS